MTATSERTTTGTTFESLNPRTGDVVGIHPVNTADEVSAAMPGIRSSVGMVRPPRLR